jgi:gas vesicle protein
MQKVIMRKLLDFITGIIVGAAFGSVIGLLLAPESGQALRQRVRSDFQEIVDEARLAAKARQEELQTQFETLTQ